MKTCLDLFSGTGSVSSQLIARGYITITLDRDMEADLQTDILNWNYKEYEPNTFVQNTVQPRLQLREK